MILMEVVTVDFIDICPTEIKPADGPKQKLNSYKYTQKPVDPSGEILIVFAHMRGGKLVIGYSVFGNYTHESFLEPVSRLKLFSNV